MNRNLRLYETSPNDILLSGATQNSIINMPMLTEIDDDDDDDEDSDDNGTSVSVSMDMLQLKYRELEIENAELRHLNQIMLMKGRECVDCKRNYKRLFRKYQKLLIEIQRLQILARTNGSNNSNSNQGLETRRLQAMLRLNV